MDNKSTKIFEENSGYILKEATRLYGITEADLTKLGSFESYVYEYEKDNQSRILKLTHSHHRSGQLIQGELEWVNYLAENKVSVPAVIPSESGNLVETIDLGDSYFLAYAFEKAEGKLPESSRWDDSLFENWGRVMGRMHALAKSYKPSNNSIKRFHWYEDASLRVENHIPASQPLVIERCNQLKNKLREIPTDMESYGLIHSDIHHGNFFVNNGDITVFDFDDCHYNWFAYDIAIPLFYVLRDSEIDPNDKSFARHFMSRFMAGYKQENAIDPVHLEVIPDFMKLRELDLYIIIHAENAQNLNGWCERYMKNRRYSIENKIPIIDIDFPAFGR
ncbi:MAG: phosphotransferase [candidate division Zixibacteria bacterium]|nr:phosphotransferase [candidate division Zixibacteria bacterium]